MKRLKKVLVFLMLVIGSLASAVDIYVPGSYTTIQAAVNAANPGDTIYVSAGIYNEAVYINKGIALVGVGTPTIDPPSGNGVTFDGNNADNASISGFRITGAGNGIYCYNGADPIITNNTIAGNSYQGIF
ncbi:hypothetical protein KKG61_02040, partial [bacterium]|nr:hypothetical protein [bacterium]